jgi:predicted ester cyclase
MARWTCHGTHKGELNGIAPTGKPFTISGVTSARLLNGKLAEGYVNWDALGMMQQIGVVPPFAAVVPQLAKAKVLAAATI